MPCTFTSSTHSLFGPACVTSSRPSHRPSFTASRLRYCKPYALLGADASTLAPPDVRQYPLFCLLNDPRDSRLGYTGVLNIDQRASSGTAVLTRAYSWHHTGLDLESIELPHRMRDPSSASISIFHGGSIPQQAPSAQETTIERGFQRSELVSSTSNASKACQEVDAFAEQSPPQ